MSWREGGHLTRKEASESVVATTAPSDPSTTAGQQPRLRLLWTTSPLYMASTCLQRDTPVCQRQQPLQRALDDGRTGGHAGPSRAKGARDQAAECTCDGFLLGNRFWNFLDGGYALWNTAGASWPPKKSLSCKSCQLQQGGNDANKPPLRVPHQQGAPTRKKKNFGGSAFPWWRV